MSFIRLLGPSFKHLLVIICLIVLSACAGKGTKQQDGATNAPEDVALSVKYQQALDLLNEEQWANAVDILESIIGERPDFPGPYLNKGIAQFKLEALAEAKSSFQQVISLADQEKTSEADGIANAEASSENKTNQPTKKAIPVINFKPFQLAALNYLGLIAREQGEFQEAESYYREALGIDDEHAPSVRNLAILLDLYRGDIAQALPLYERYQSLLEEPDSQVKDWIFDIKARLPNEPKPNVPN